MKCSFIVSPYDHKSARRNDVRWELGIHSKVQWRDCNWPWKDDTQSWKDHSASPYLHEIYEIIGRDSRNRRDDLHLDSAYKSNVDMFLTSNKGDIWNNRQALENLLGFKIFHPTSELDIFLRDDWRCQDCGNKDETLHVHHKIYRKSDPWDVPSSDLITLCESCHEVETFNRGDVESRLLRSLKKFGMLTSHLESRSDYFEVINQYSDSLEDEKWLDREKELLKADKACFICHTKENLIIYHKSPCCITHKP